MAACRGTSTTPARAKLALLALTRFVPHHCPHDWVHAVHWVLTLRLPLSWSQSSNSCASCATYATSDVASAVASACHTRQDVLDLVSDISAGPCPVLKVTATSSTYLAGTYNIMPGFEVNGAPVYLREEYVGVVPAPRGIVLPLVTPCCVLLPPVRCVCCAVCECSSKYYLRFTGSRYLFEQTLNSGTYWGAVDYTGKYLGDAGTNGVFTFRCQCQDGAKRTAKCDCADGLNADASDICRPCAAPLYLPRPPATQACSACPAMTHRSGATTECDIVGCHAYYFDVTREGSNMNWYCTCWRWCGGGVVWCGGPHGCGVCAGTRTRTCTWILRPPTAR